MASPGRGVPTNGTPDPHNRVLAFFLLTYAWSWIAWIPLVWTLTAQGRLGQIGGPDNPLAGIPSWVMLFWLLGSYGPTAAGLILAGRDGGWLAVKRLLKGLLVWRVGTRWHLVAILAPMAFLLAGMAIHALWIGELLAPGFGRMWLMIPAFVFAIPFGPLAEEFGWRGYVLPRLQRRHTALASAVIIGVAWTFWHIPLYWAPAGTTISGGPVSVWAVSKYLLATIPASILMTWIFNNTRGSILLSVAYHTAGNAGIALFLFPQQTAEVARRFDELAMIPAWIAAIAVVAIFGARRLSKRPLEGRMIAEDEV